jgi:hypothetical protein
VTDSNGASASASFSLTVGQAAQAITFASTAPANPSIGGKYTVGASGGGSGNPVTFSIDAASTADACAISGAIVTFTGTGSCVIDANQAGNNDYTAAAQVQQAVSIGKVDSTIMLTSSANPSAFAQTITLTATVTPNAGNVTPTGTVDFTDGGTAIAGCSGVMLNSGVAVCTTATLSIGSHDLQASYGGDDNTVPSNGTLTQIVDEAGTTITLTVSPNPASAGQAVTLMASVSVDTPAVTRQADAAVVGEQFIAPSSVPTLGATNRPSARAGAIAMVSAATPIGTVTFYDGTTMLGAAALGANGTATDTISTLAAGTHVLSAVYAGNGDYAQAVAQVTLEVNEIVPAPMLSWWMLLSLSAVLAVLGAAGIRFASTSRRTR